jgi:plasmid stability protein
MTSPSLKVTFYLPPSVKRALEDRATENHRSQNGELLAILEAALAKGKKP